LTTFQKAVTQSLLTFILQVVGVLPHIEDQQRHRAVTDMLPWVVVDLLADQAASVAGVFDRSLGVVDRLVDLLAGVLHRALLLPAGSETGPGKGE
jgi:hypothetical protein